MGKQFSTTKHHEKLPEKQFTQRFASPQQAETNMLQVTGNVACFVNALYKFSLSAST